MVGLSILLFMAICSCGVLKCGVFFEFQFLEPSQASSHGTRCPLAAGLWPLFPIRYLCRMHQSGHPVFISHWENLYIDSFVWLPLSFPQCTPAMFIAITTLCPFVQVSMRTNVCTPLTAAVGHSRNGTQRSVLKHVPLLWTYCNSSTWINSRTLINLSLGWLTKRSLQIEQGCRGRIFELAVQKRQLKTGAFQNIWKRHRFTN